MNVLWISVLWCREIKQGTGQGGWQVQGRSWKQAALVLTLVTWQKEFQPGVSSTLQIASWILIVTSMGLALCLLGHSC